ncbi:MAG: maleylacetoacetate isomerase [Caulobacteraceae bacterium]|nr:maleylacetoacetate isomerase [Caulobacteraceae bacterium]
MSQPILHGFGRSSASYRVRIALNLKGIAYRDVPYALRDGEQRSPAYLALNPQGLVPTLDVDGLHLTQSLAICEYLDEIQPYPPLLPADPLARARVRAFAQVIACDIHPVQNLKVLKRLRALGHDEAAVSGWARQVIEEGFDACETLIAGQSGPYCFGDQVSLADICLVPQLANAHRFGVILRWPRLEAAEQACQALEAFSKAAPQEQA